VRFRLWLREYWKNFRDFLISQILCSLLITASIAAFMWHYGQISDAASLAANAKSIGFTFTSVVAAFATGNLVWTVFRHEKRAHDARVAAEALAEERALQLSTQPRPNLVFSQLRSVPVETDASGQLVKVDKGIFQSPIFNNVVLFTVLNEVKQSDSVVGAARLLSARLVFLPEEPTSPACVVDSAYWFRHGGAVNINPGKSGSIALCGYRFDIPSTIETAPGGRPSFTDMSAGEYNVVATLCCQEPSLYVKRFHLLLNTRLPHSARPCSGTADTCSVCRQYDILNT
jgi:hypothetical protein